MCHCVGGGCSIIILLHPPPSTSSGDPLQRIKAFWSIQRISSGPARLTHGLYQSGRERRKIMVKCTPVFKRFFFNDDPHIWVQEMNYFWLIDLLIFYWLILRSTVSCFFTNYFLVDAQQPEAERTAHLWDFQFHPRRKSPPTRMTKFEKCLRIESKI